MSTREPRPEAGVHLLVSFTGNELTVIRAARIANVRRTLLREPLLTQWTWERFSRPMSELALAVLDEKGTVLDSFGWSPLGQSFFDTAGPEGQGMLVGASGPARQSLRVMRIPLRPGAAFLLFYLSNLAFASPGSFTQRPLALYGLANPFSPFPPGTPPGFPIPRPKPIPPIPLPWVTPDPRRFVKPALKRPELFEYWGNKGYIVDVQTLVNNGDPAHRFDIVILGDGFGESELGMFDSRAQAISNGLLSTPPFSALAAWINVHVVRTVSVDSGVDDCPIPGQLRSTYYNVKGDFHATGYPGFFGTPTPERAWHAAEMITPLENVDLLLMLANVNYEGGSAFPGQEMAFVSQWSTDAQTARIAAHECCHVIAGTCEEYISCNPNDPLVTYPNQATEAQGSANTVWWSSLATAAEWSASGFNAVHRLGDLFDGSGNPVMPTGLQGMLGLYWGCQDIDPALSGGPGCDPYRDPRGAGFYRPTGRCRMRRSGDPFCRVCSQLMTDIITAAAT